VETTKAMSLDIAIRRFLPLKNHLGDVEILIRKLGGEVPSFAKVTENRPSYASASGGASTNKSADKPESTPTPPPTFLRKDLRTALKDNKEMEDQLITSQPIKIEGFDGPVRPSLKNWLSDYIRLEGVGPHSLMVLTDYLYNSPNGKLLVDPKEKKLVGKILQSYDENTLLPVSDKTGLIALEHLDREAVASPLQSSTVVPPKAPSRPAAAEQDSQPLRPEPYHPEFLKSSTTQSPSAPPPPVSPPAPSQEPPQQTRYPQPIPMAKEMPPRQQPVAPPSFPPQPPPRQPLTRRETLPSASPQRQDGYLEPIDDLESGAPPSRQTPSFKRPYTDPRIDGNIIDLKNTRKF
jgi:hypothetical protein